MAPVLHLATQRMSSLENSHLEFKHDVKSGLEKMNKQIPSKYLYDTKGSALFNQITRHPDYYLTNCEIDILNQHKQRIAELVGNEEFNLIELGPGEGIKTQILMEQFIQSGLNFTYIPIDISSVYLEEIADKHQKTFPEMNTMALHTDYFRGLEWLKKNNQQPNVVLFLGSSIGNFTTEHVYHFLHQLHLSLNAGDYVLLGFDLCKEIDILMRAYDDGEGITRAFNLNLLQRMNKELGADFVLDNFYHHAVYNAQHRAMESYLVCVKPQEIYMNQLNQHFTFEAYEALHTEFSHKYIFSQIQTFAERTGFNVVKHFVDQKGYFLDSLWQVEDIR